MTRPPAFKRPATITAEALRNGNSRVLNEAISELSTYVGRYKGGGVENPALAIAQMVDGELLTLTLNPDSDTPASHTLGRRPTLIAFQRTADGRMGQVVGTPDGGTPSVGDPINETPWTDDMVYLRASRAGTYQVVIA